MAFVAGHVTDRMRAARACLWPLRPNLFAIASRLTATNAWIGVRATPALGTTILSASLPSLPTSQYRNSSEVRNRLLVLQSGLTRCPGHIDIAAI